MFNVPLPYLHKLLHNNMEKAFEFLPNPLRRISGVTAQFVAVMESPSWRNENKVIWLIKSIWTYQSLFKSQSSTYIISLWAYKWQEELLSPKSWFIILCDVFIYRFESLTAQAGGYIIRRWKQNMILLVILAYYACCKNVTDCTYSNKCV